MATDEVAKKRFGSAPVKGYLRSFMGPPAHSFSCLLLTTTINSVRVFVRRSSFIKSVLITWSRSNWLSDSQPSRSAEEKHMVCLSVSGCLSVYTITKERVENTTCALKFDSLSQKSRLLLKFRPLAQFVRIVVMEPSC